MKLRGKLVLLESAISLIFFISLLISLFVLNNGFQVYDLFKNSKEMNHLVQKIQSECNILLYTSNPSMDDVEMLWDNASSVTTQLNRLTRSRRMYRFPDEILERLERINSQWMNIQSNFYPSSMSSSMVNFLSDKERFESSLIKTMNTLKKKNSVDLTEQEREYIETGENYQNYVLQLQQLQLQTDLFTQEVEENLDAVKFKQITNVAIFNFVMIMISFLVVLVYMGKLMNQIGFIKKALDDVAEGDLSARLRIRSKDEFGKLSRDFNTVIEILWSKLETVQNILEDVGKSISNEINLDRAEKAILYLARKNSSADGVAYFKIKGDEYLSIAHIQGSYHPPFMVEGEDELFQDFANTDDLIATFKDSLVPLEGNLLGDTARSGEAIFLKDVPQKQLWIRPEKHPYYISSLINLPLRVGNRVMGVISLIKNTPGEFFSDLEYTNMLSFGELASISIDNLLKYQEMLDVYELNREIDIAAEIQNDLLPQSIPKIQGIDLSLASRTLRGINGDFYDSYLLSNNKLLVVVSEVAGKGVPAALVIIMLKTIIKLVAHPDKNAAQIIEELNQNITERIKIENIATLSLMIIDHSTQSISYASAGHQPMVIYDKKEGDYKEYKPKGIPVGLDKNADYENMTIPLESGKMFLQFTDGVPETRDRDGKVYGIEGLIKIVNKYSDQSAERIKNEILDDLEFFQRDTKQWDDQTLFVMKKES